MVTAAHCVKETPPVGVRLGDSDLRTEFDCLDVEEGCDSKGWVRLELQIKIISRLTAELALMIFNVLLVMWTIRWKISSFTRNSPLRR